MFIHEFGTGPAGVIYPLLASPTETATQPEPPTPTASSSSSEPSSPILTPSEGSVEDEELPQVYSNITDSETRFFEQWLKRGPFDGVEADLKQSEDLSTIKTTAFILPPGDKVDQDGGELKPTITNMGHVKLTLEWESTTRTWTGWLVRKGESGELLGTKKIVIDAEKQITASSESPPTSSIQWSNSEKVQKGELSPIEPAEDPKFANSEAKPWVQWLKRGLFDGVEAVYDKVDYANNITAVTCTAYLLPDETEHCPLDANETEPLHKTFVTDDVTLTLERKDDRTRVWTGWFALKDEGGMLINRMDVVIDIRRLCEKPTDA